MRLQVTSKDGLTYDGVHYAQGEELEVEDTWRGKMWSAAFQAKRLARRHEPVVVGTPTPMPNKAMRAEGAPKETAVAPVTTHEAPQTEAPWLEPAWTEQKAEEATEGVESTEGTDEAGTPRRRGRYARRDLRSAE